MPKTKKREMHDRRCAYAGLPIEERGQLPRPAPQDGSDMCICDWIDREEAR
jgi:hypothetical protein